MPRKKKTTEEQVLSWAVKHWTQHYTGSSSLDIARALKLDNEEVMGAMLKLESSDLAKLNKDVELTPIIFGKPGIDFDAPVKCHILFPSPNVLSEHFYSSDLARTNPPAYQERVLKGAHPYSSVFFQEEVLRKYLTRPDLYDVSDTVSGGHITYTGEDDALFIYVRHGRRKLDSGRGAVVALLTDLLRLSEAEQRYWHGFELIDTVFALEDDGYATFREVTFEGKWVAYEDPVSEALAAIKRVNGGLGVAIFRNTDNELLHAPVENTEKAYCDACSELYKLIGNDSLNKDILEALLVEKFGADKSEFIHKETKRPLSGLQLLQLLETKTEAGNNASKAIKSIGEDRVKAAHALTFKGDPGKIYIDSFRNQCLKLSTALDQFSEKTGETITRRAPKPETD